MKKIAKLFLLLGGLFLLFSVAIFLLNKESFAPSAPFIPQQPTLEIGDIFEQVNLERTQVGLKPLKMNGSLEIASDMKATHMCENQYWSHYSPENVAPWDFMKKVEYKYSIAGENLAKDFSEVETMVVGWMNSPSHRDNIVNPRYTETGIALKKCVFQGMETVLVVQFFASK